MTELGVELRGHPESAQSLKKLIHRLLRFHRFKQDWHCFFEYVKSEQSVDVLLDFSDGLLLPSPPSPLCGRQYPIEENVDHVAGLGLHRSVLAAEVVREHRAVN